MSCRFFPSQICDLATTLKVVFIGVVHPSVRKKIPADIEIRPPIANSDLPKILKNADMLGIFYKNSPYIQGVIPAKFFECLATGKPVLVSGLMEATPYLDTVFDVQGLAKIAIKTIKKLPAIMTSARLARQDVLAQEADWTNRFNSFMSCIEKAYQKK